MIIYPFSLRKENISVSICSGHDRFFPVAFFFFLNWTRQRSVSSLYNVVLVSASQWSESGIRICIHPLPVDPPPSPAHPLGPTSLCSFPLARCPTRAGVYCQRHSLDLPHPSRPTTAPPLRLRLEDSRFSDRSPPTPHSLRSLCHLFPDLQGLGFQATPSFFHLKFLSHQHRISFLKPKSNLTHPPFHLSATLFSKAPRTMCL